MALRKFRECIKVIWAQASVAGVPKVDVERADLAPITVADGRCGSGHC